MRSISNLSKISILVLISGALLFTGSITKQAQAAPQTITVNSTGDQSDGIPGDGICATPGGSCTLRAAIETANNNGNPSDQDIIEFDITPLNGGLKTISQSSEMPSADASMVVTQNVLIDGYTQDSASPNTADFPDAFNGTMLIEISGEGHHNYAPSIRFSTGSAGSSVRGINFSDFPGMVISIDDINISIQGNYINTTSNGNGANWKVVTDTLDGAIGVNSSGANIGGSLPEHRNVIASNNFALAATEDADNLTIKGNNFMVGSDGITAMPAISSLVQLYGADNVTIGGSSVVEGNFIENSGASGIDIQENSSNISILGNRMVGNNRGVSVVGGSNVTLGGSGSSEYNVISGNRSDGVFILSSSNVSVLNNKIGVTSDGTTSFPNDANGIYIQDSTGVSIGSFDSPDANIIANNESDGISINGATSKVAVLINSIYNNGSIGIDLYDNGETPNDQNDTDSGPNDMLNFPEVYEPVINGADLDVSYGLDVPAGDYLIQFYSNDSADPSGYGEGQTYVGSQLVTSLGTGVQQFTTSISGNSHSNVFATATLIDPEATSGYSQTSEFSNRAVPPPPVIDVSLEKTLSNPEDVAPGATLNYQLTYINNGPDALDLTQFSSVLSGGPILYDYLSPDLEPTNQTGDGPIPGSKIIDVNNTDLFCLWAGPGSVGSFLGDTSRFANYSFVACWYVGATTELASEGTIVLNISVNVSNDSNLAIVNYAFAPPPIEDPDLEALQEVVGGLTGILDMPSLINNFTFAQLPQDINISSSIINSDQLDSSSTELTYNLGIKNNGQSSIDLSHYFNAQANSLAVIIYDSSKLSFAGALNENINCVDFGPGTAASLGTGGQDHHSYNLVACTHDPDQEEILSPGETYNLQLMFNIFSLSSGLDIYAVTLTPPNDPDIPDFYSEFLSATGDVLDTIQNNNFTRASYLAYSGASPQNPASNGGIASTGQNSLLVILFGLTLVSLGAASVYYPKNKNLKR